MANEQGKDAHQLLQDVIQGDDKLLSNTLYNNWAPIYERDMKEVKYFGPTDLMKHFDKLGVKEGAKILDICAGTGGIGRELAKLGFTDIHGVDGAEHMLELARKEGNYKSLTHLLFQPDTKLPFEDRTFDCALLAGAFAPGHLPIVVLREIVRVTKIGGVIAWICCDPAYYADKDPQYANNGFYKFLDELRIHGYWKEREGFPIPSPYIEYSDGFVMAFDVLDPSSVEGSDRRKAWEEGKVDYEGKDKFENIQKKLDEAIAQ